MFINKRSGKTYRRVQALPDQWKRNVRKVKRNSGESYVSNNGIVRPARNVLKEPCGEKCRIKCNNRFTVADREQLLKDFWKLGKLSSQREYIVQHLAEIETKYGKKEGERKRRLNFSYNFYVNGELRKVCRLFFVNTLNISDRMIRGAVEKFYKASNGLFLEGEQRGKHSKAHKKISEN